MERRIVKTAIYSFISGLAVLILLVPYKIVERYDNVETITYRPTHEYVYTLLWYSTLITFLSVLAVIAFTVFERLQNE